MRLASVRPDQLAVVRDDGLVNISDSLAQSGALPKGASMPELIARYDTLQGAIATAAEQGTATALDPAQLRPPVPNPSKIWAAASNYKRGGTGLDNAAGRGTATSASPETLLEMAFLKPPSAIIGPEEAVVIPAGVEAVFPELELCVVIGKEARNVSREEVLDAVFGYTIILDMTARNRESVQRGLIASRCVRKGYDTFAPIGPWITTRDEIPDPRALAMRLWVNGELKQSAMTDGMINGVAELVSYLSQVGTLYPGDLIATGNPDSPDFQQTLGPGNVLQAEIERIGTLTVYVRNA